MKGQAAIKVQQEEIEEYERRNHLAVKPTRLPGIGIPEDPSAKRRLENAAWQKQVNSINAKRECVYKTATENAEAAFAILNDDLYSKDEKLQGVYAFLEKALQQ